MNKVDIYTAILVSFDGISDKKCNETGEKLLSKILEFTNIRSVDCVIDEKRGNAIEIETGVVYHIIKRDRCGNLLPGEAEKIKHAESGSLFVYRYYMKSMENISLLYQMYIKNRAQRKYQEYLENIEKVEPANVKTINKK